MASRNRDAGRESFWRATLKRQAAGGLSVRAFCRQEGLAESNFYAWRRTIARRDREPTTARRSARRNGRVKRPGEVPAFLPAVVTGERVRDTSIVVERAGGLRLRFHESIEPQRLAEIVHALEGEAAS